MKKIITFIFLVTFFTIPMMLVFAQSTSTQAEGTSTGWHLTQGEEGGCMEIELPFIPKCGATPASYLSGLYRLALGLGVLAALIMIVVAGITYATSGDNASKQKEARGQIKDAIIGMVILFASVLILRTINPALISMTLRNISSLPTPSPTSSTSTPSLGNENLSRQALVCVYGPNAGTRISTFGGCYGDICLTKLGERRMTSEECHNIPKCEMCEQACITFCAQKYPNK